MDSQFSQNRVKVSGCRGCLQTRGHYAHHAPNRSIIFCCDIFKKINIRYLLSEQHHQLDFLILQRPRLFDLAHFLPPHTWLSTCKSSQDSSLDIGTSFVRHLKTDSTNFYLHIKGIRYDLNCQFNKSNN